MHNLCHYWRRFENIWAEDQIFSMAGTISIWGSGCRLPSLTECGTGEDIYSMLAFHIIVSEKSQIWPKNIPCSARGKFRRFQLKRFAKANCPNYHHYCGEWKKPPHEIHCFHPRLCPHAKKRNFVSLTTVAWAFSLHRTSLPNPLDLRSSKSG